MNLGQMSYSPDNHSQPASQIQTSMTAIPKAAVGNYTFSRISAHINFKPHNRGILTPNTIIPKSLYREKEITYYILVKPESMCPCAM